MANLDQSDIYRKSKRGNVVTSLEDLIEGNSATSSGKLYSKPTRLEHHWEFRCVGFFCWWKHLIRQSDGWDNEEHDAPGWRGGAEPIRPPFSFESRMTRIMMRRYPWANGNRARHFAVETRWRTFLRVSHSAFEPL